MGVVGGQNTGSRQTSKYTDTLVPCGSKCHEDQSEVGRQRMTGYGAGLGMVVGLTEWCRKDFPEELTSGEKSEWNDNWVMWISGMEMAGTTEPSQISLDLVARSSLGSPGLFQPSSPWETPMSCRAARNGQRNHSQVMGMIGKGERLAGKSAELNTQKTFSFGGISDVPKRISEPD